MATFTVRDLTLACVAAVRILGIDPGTRIVGFGCLEFELAPSTGVADATPVGIRAVNVLRVAQGAGLRVVDVGVLRLGSSGVSVPQRLLALADLIRDLLQRLQPDELAIEEAFYGKSAQAALRIGEARGVVLAEAARARLSIHQFTPARIKRCVVGHGGVGKQVVASMLLRQLPAAGAPEFPFQSDATDALAVAFTRVEQRKSPLLWSRREVGSRDGGTGR